MSRVSVFALAVGGLLVLCGGRAVPSAMMTSAQGGPAGEADKAAVRQAAYDYAEGYYEGAADRMARPWGQTPMRRHRPHWGLTPRHSPRAIRTRT